MIANLYSNGENWQCFPEFAGNDRTCSYVRTMLLLGRDCNKTVSIWHKPPELAGSVTVVLSAVTGNKLDNSA